jgi:hypothetical protein
MPYMLQEMNLARKVAQLPRCRRVTLLGHVTLLDHVTELARRTL